jgi:hypothetical protein
MRPPRVHGAVVVTLRVQTLLFAGFLTLVSFSLPAQGAASCDAGTTSSVASASQAWYPDAGAACTVSDETTGIGASVCIEVLSDEFYVFEALATWDTPVDSNQFGSSAETPCTAHEGEAQCEAWQFDADLSSVWPYPNAGGQCSFPVLGGPLCVGLADDGFFTPYAGTEGMGTDCKGDYGCTTHADQGVFYECSNGYVDPYACAEFLDDHWTEQVNVAGIGNHACGPERIPYDGSS